MRSHGPLLCAFCLCFHFNETAGSRSPTGSVVQVSAATVSGYHASRHCRLAFASWSPVGALIWILYGYALLLV